MFNAEQLLGKIMGEMVGSGSGHKKGKKKKGGSMVNSLTSSLMSGKGLITAIGLGVGAYEILKSKQGANPPSPPPPMGYGAPSPSASSVSLASSPPPIPGVEVNPPHDPGLSSGQEENLALRLIQVMIAAAHADGGMDPEEEARILEKLQGQGLSQEEKRFILVEMHDPKPIDQLTAGISDPRIAQTMYGLAVSAVVVDTPEERAWLDRLATALSISEGMRRFIEEDQ
jgi:uncharacterized membrane protein YebE (DUF533 family)